MEHLIPPAWFEPLPSLLLLLIGAAAILALLKGADALVNSASGLAVRLGMPEVIVGATIVSLGTTSPEAAVSVMAAWSGEAGLALGNGVGSIIADTGLIFGIGCLMARLPADRFILRRQGWVQVGSAALLAAICYGAYILHRDAAALERWVGILLVSLLVAYLWMSVRWARQHPGGELFKADQTIPPHNAPQSAPQQKPRRISAMLTMGAMGLAVVILASHVLIVCVSIVAVRWGVPKVVIAGTIVALGTSMPELVIGLTAVRRGHPEILVGNVIGADILNVLFVIGASALARPLPILEADAARPAIFLQLHLPALLLILVLFRLFIARSVGRGYFHRWYGLPLLAVYFAYVAAAYLLV
jgi:cation:H+ antiporter